LKIEIEISHLALLYIEIHFYIENALLHIKSMES